MLVEDFYKPRHVCALEIMWQVHVHIEISDCVLFTSRAIFDTHRIFNIFDADFINSKTARV
ncbi:hypothetical protein THIOM_000069 [Candidatus Thiomargarita nelsonii]|uniref:Uncharacterized protein n=1 Tax=Candidatus Thiomargarita nelsonii TaxID=1003181 RepID=A0A176S7I8_9GAMM|nr:hypothetical protein THIOM_000069 [Candidatus Thiomargarita nelsonii]